MVNVAFFIRQFSERGTEVSTYNYAHYNETILGNKSIIIYFSPLSQKKILDNDIRCSFEQFHKRFVLIEINSFAADMPTIIQNFKLDFFYALTHGGNNDIYNFNDKSIWIPPCKTIKHCVFRTDGKEGDYYVSIGNFIKEKQPQQHKLDVIPHIVDLPKNNENEREAFKIPNNAIVFGRHGGMDSFNIPFVKNAIQDTLKKHPNYYFLFLNTSPFFKHPRILHVNKTTDLLCKVRFINTCDAMIHARDIGESFGLAVAEFSLLNKPVFTCNIGDKEHIHILKEKAVIYNDYDELMSLFDHAPEIIKSRDNWNAYQNYSPEKVMKIFNECVFLSERNGEKK